MKPFEPVPPRELRQELSLCLRGAKGFMVPAPCCPRSENLRTGAFGAVRNIGLCIVAVSVSADHMTTDLRM